MYVTPSPSPSEHGGRDRSVPSSTHSTDEPRGASFARNFNVAVVDSVGSVGPLVIEIFGAACRSRAAPAAVAATSAITIVPILVIIRSFRGSLSRRARYVNVETGPGSSSLALFDQTSEDFRRVRSR
jgi:hypothetical protein